MTVFFMIFDLGMIGIDSLKLREKSLNIIKIQLFGLKFVVYLENFKTMYIITNPDKSDAQPKRIGAKAESFIQKIAIYQSDHKNTKNLPVPDLSDEAAVGMLQLQTPFRWSAEAGAGSAGCQRRRHDGGIVQRHGHL